MAASFTSKALVSLLATGWLLASAPAHAFTFNNGSFDTPAAGVPVGSVTTLATISSPPYTYFGTMQSAASNWTLYNNTIPGTTTSVLANAPGGYPSMLIFASGTANGLVQQFAPTNTKTGRVRLSAWIYVLSGSVGMSMGNGGFGGTDAYTTGTGTWQYLSICGRSDGLNSEVTFYSNSGVSTYYVDDVTVVTDNSCPAS